MPVQRAGVIRVILANCLYLFAVLGFEPAGGRPRSAVVLPIYNASCQSQVWQSVRMPTSKVFAACPSVMPPGSVKNCLNSSQHRPPLPALQSVIRRPASTGSPLLVSIPLMPRRIANSNRLFIRHAALPSQRLVNHLPVKVWGQFLGHPNRGVSGQSIRLNNHKSEVQ